MNIDNIDLNVFINKYINFVDLLCYEKKYDSNIKHLLYVIVPSFIIKYGLEYEKLILDCFEQTKILISNEDNNNIKALFGRNVYYEENYKSSKYILLYNYSSTLIIEMIDNIIHEYNHAINSMNNEIKSSNNKIYLRTGLCNIVYSADDLINPIEKEKSFMLEEIINTRQTEQIIDIIKSLNKKEIKNNEIKTLIENICYEVNNINYQSDAYSFYTSVCNILINNKTFFSTLEKLRINGENQLVEEWFDNIVGIKGEYCKLIENIFKVYDLEKKFLKIRFFKKHYIRKLENYVNVINQIINEFNNSCNFK